MSDPEARVRAAEAALMRLAARDGLSTVARMKLRLLDQQLGAQVPAGERARRARVEAGALLNLLRGSRQLGEQAALADAEAIDRALAEAVGEAPALEGATPLSGIDPSQVVWLPTAGRSAAAPAAPGPRVASQGCRPRLPRDAGRPPVSRPRPRRAAPGSGPPSSRPRLPRAAPGSVRPSSRRSPSTSGAWRPPEQPPLPSPTSGAWQRPPEQPPLPSATSGAWQRPPEQPPLPSPQRRLATPPEQPPLPSATAAPGSDRRAEARARRERLAGPRVLHPDPRRKPRPRRAGPARGQRSRARSRAGCRASRRRPRPWSAGASAAGARPARRAPPPRGFASVEPAVVSLGGGGGTDPRVRLRAPVVRGPRLERAPGRAALPRARAGRG